MKASFDLNLNTILKKIRLLRSNLNIGKTLKLIWGTERKWTIYNLIMILVETGSFFMSLYAVKLLIDGVSVPGLPLSEQKAILFKRLLEASLAAIVFMVSRSVSAYVIEKQSSRVAAFLDDKIHKKAVELDLSFYESPRYFDILKRAKDAGDDRPGLVIKTLSEILKNSLTFLAMTVVLVTIDWVLIPILILLIFPLLLVKLIYADKQNMLRIRQTSAERQATYLSGLITSETTAKEIRSFELGRYLRSVYLKIRLDLLDQKLGISLRRAKKEIWLGLIVTVGFFVCIGYISYSAVNGQTSVGDIALFLVIFPQSFNVAQNLSSGISIVYQNNIYVLSIFDLFDLKSTLREPAEPADIDALDSFRVDMKNVSFTYPHNHRPTLTNISMHIPPGKIIGVTGPNGSGKTTLIKLLSRLYEVSDGEILLGGRDIRDFDIRDYHKEVSVVFQDFVKYNFSVKENIHFGNIQDSLQMEDIRKAANRSGADQFIDKLPEAYESMMGRIFADGHEVSIGQWQKLALARVFYSKARLIILDEATSALDAVAEKKLIESLRDNLGDRSALLISHRYSTLRQTDYIYVLHDGKVAQSGTHKALVNEDGVFKILFKEEAKRFEELLATE